MYPLPPQSQPLRDYNSLAPRPQQQPQPQQQTNQSPNNNPTQPTKSRPSASCIPCRNRKVKCNRQTPCTTCISRNHPEQCTYTTTDSDREAMKQAEVISDLRRKVRGLKMQISEGECDGGEEEYDRDEHEAMEVLVRKLRDGEGEVVDAVVGMVRDGYRIEDVAGFIRSQRQSQGQSVIEVV